MHKDGAHLHIDEILAFLWECFEENPQAVYCGYYLGYDFNQWLKTLPKDRAEILLNPAKRARTKSGGNTVPFPVYYTASDGTEWELDLLGTKRFKIRKQGAKPWLYVCDVGAFYQQAFATAMSEKWQDRQGNPIRIVDPDEMQTIIEGKARRATASFDKAMIRYNVAENRVLSRMMKTLAEGFKEMGVSLRRSEWFGPGQVAQKWMDQHAKQHNAAAIQKRAETEETFRAALDAARGAYFGGWFETVAHGHVGTAYEYDISSAYPHIHSRLPCLLHGEWKHVDGGASTAGLAWVLVRADVYGSNPYLGAMLHRDRTGRINRPLFTSGWYWQHELEAAKRARLVDEICVHEAFAYQPCSCAPPMRDLRALYQQRLDVGKSTPQGRGLKLTYNSCYGKTAQSIGSPKHANSIHASLITAGCRAMICDAIATHPRGASAVLMIATDGIYFDSPHPLLAGMPPALGNWEEQRKDNLSIFLPGVYWDDVSRASREGKAAKLKSRGVSAKDLIARLDDLDAQFNRMLSEQIPWRMFEGDVAPEWWAKLSLPLGFQMISAKQALAWNRWEDCGRVTQAAIRELDSNPTYKRLLVNAPTKERPYIHTTPPENRRREASTAYSKTFGMRWQMEAEADEILTETGDAIDEVYEIVRG